MKNGNKSSSHQRPPSYQAAPTKGHPSYKITSTKGHPSYQAKQPDKRGGSGLRVVIFGGSDLTRRMTFGGCGLIRGCAKRGAFGGSGLIRLLNQISNEALNCCIYFFNSPNLVFPGYSFSQQQTTAIF
jgi:hypothetical protein